MRHQKNIYVYILHNVTSLCTAKKQLNKILSFVSAMDWWQTGKKNSNFVIVSTRKFVYSFYGRKANIAAVYMFFQTSTIL